MRNVTAREAMRCVTRSKLKAQREEAKALAALTVISRYFDGKDTEAFSASITHVNALAQLIAPGTTRFGC